jgi:hypothetical protein
MSMKTMTAAERDRLDKLLRELSREYARLSDDGRDALHQRHRGLGWALARIIDHYDHIGRHGSVDS